MDGAYGTLLYDENRSDILPEEWNIIDPYKVTNITELYLNAGASIIKTNTFNCGPRWDSKYDWKNVILRAYCLQAFNFKFHEIAASIGPQKYSIIAGDKFSDVVEGYYEITKEHLLYKPDYILLETQIEARVIRAAIIGINKAVSEGQYKPKLIVNVCVKPNGTMQDGSDVKQVLNMALVMGASYVGVNCSSGAEIDYDLVQNLVNEVPNFVWCPNNGMPDENGYYSMASDVWAGYVNKLNNLAIVGGCCGTTPAHISQLKVKDILEVKLKHPKLFDEKFNIFGSKKFKSQVESDDWSGIFSRMLNLPNGLGIDVNLDDGVNDEQSRWNSLQGIQLITQTHPFMIDSESWKKWMLDVVEKCNGVVYFNSVVQNDNTQELILELNSYGIIPILRAKSHSVYDEKCFNLKDYEGVYLKDASVQVLGINDETIGNLINRISYNRTVLGISNATFALRGNSLRKEATRGVFNELKQIVDVVIGPEYLWDTVVSDSWLRNPNGFKLNEPDISEKELSIIRGDSSWIEMLNSSQEDMIIELTETLYKLGESFASGRVSLLQLVEAGNNANKLINLIPKVDVCGKQVIIATVEGDLHDIGKNITKLLLESAGYQVLDLGINVSVSDIIKAINTDTVAIAMSGLIAQSLSKMKENIKELRKVTSLPIFLGGAVVSEEFVSLHIKDNNIYYTTDGLSMASVLKSIAN